MRTVVGVCVFAAVHVPSISCHPPVSHPINPAITAQTIKILDFGQTAGIEEVSLPPLPKLRYDPV